MSRTNPTSRQSGALLWPTEASDQAGLVVSYPVSAGLEPFVERYWTVQWDRTGQAPFRSEVLSHLYLSDVERDALRQIERAGRIPLDDVVYLVPATERVGEATEVALRHAQRWLAENGDSGEPASGGFSIRAVRLLEPDDAGPPSTEPINILASEDSRMAWKRIRNVDPRGAPDPQHVGQASGVRTAIW